MGKELFMLSGGLLGGLRTSNIFMKAWKMLVLAPYALIALWLWASFGFATSSLVGVFLGPVMILYGMGALALYTIVLGTALLARRAVLKRRKVSSVVG